jgi:hypothetical protein
MFLGGAFHFQSFSSAISIVYVLWWVYFCVFVAVFVGAHSGVPEGTSTNRHRLLAHVYILPEKAA